MIDWDLNWGQDPCNWVKRLVELRWLSWLFFPFFCGNHAMCRGLVDLAWVGFIYFLNVKVSVYVWEISFIMLHCDLEVISIFPLSEYGTATFKLSRGCIDRRSIGLNTSTFIWHNGTTQRINLTTSIHDQAFLDWLVHRFIASLVGFWLLSFGGGCSMVNFLR